MKPLGLGIIGLHHQHPRWYWPLWKHLPEYKPVAIADADEKFLASEKTFFGLDSYADYRELLGRSDVDVVIIWLPHSEMPQAVAAAAQAGKHVIVEKPCAADLAGGEAIAATAKKFPDLKISAPYCWRTHPVSKRIVSAMRAGLFGRVTALQARLNAGGAHRYIRDKSPWMLKSSEGGGPMWNLGVHWIDYFRWITGREIVSVSGITSGPFSQPARDIEDNAQALLTFDDGATGMLDISYGLRDSYPDKRDIYVALRGTEGAFAWNPNWESTSNELLLVSEHESITEENRCQRINVDCKTIPGYCGEMAWRWLRDFASAVNEDRQPLVSVDDIVSALRVADAFYRSLRSGQRTKPTNPA